ncbi:MAG TPA: D-tyrosyl-tRNA(Tyr) deacylase [Candidatus Latescibacteria bacterium]|nr:D-tyrosyl-tRNA(Tyr) deacylase [Candidatus Latescibacterota bacterium]
MRVVLQRVSSASVRVDGNVIGDIGPGLVLLIGIHRDDTDEDMHYVMDKCVHLRIFSDETGKMNHSVLDMGGELLVVSQFTLYGDTRKGRRPGFDQAGRPDMAEPLYERAVARLRDHGLQVATGRFGANMQVDLINDGPVTLIIEHPQ